jgi:hypothetical protein
VVQGEPAGPMRDDDEPEVPVSRRGMDGHLHLERDRPTQHRGQSAFGERPGHEERRGRCPGGIPQSSREHLARGRVLDVDPAIGDVCRRRSPRREGDGQQHAEHGESHDTCGHSGLAQLPAELSWTQSVLVLGRSLVPAVRSVQRPVNFGARFSLNAATPSAWSAVMRTRPMCELTKSRCVRRSSFRLW